MTSFTEQQDVVLTEKKDGYIAILKTLGQYHVYSVSIFIQGKLIDIITSKESILDIDVDSLLLSIKRTFGEGKQITISPNSIAIISTEIHKLLKTTKNQLLTLGEKFLESYLITQTLQEGSTIINTLLQTLQQKYHLKHLPYRIEAIDISHFQGDRTS